MKHNIPVGHALLKCEVCRYEIGLFEPGRLQVPLTVEMFKPLRPGWPHPLRHVPALAHTKTWEAAACVMCGRRPFHTRDHVLTPEGLFKVGDPLLPRKPTQEDKNQAEIDRVWAEDQEKAKTVEEKNQERIEVDFGKPLPVVELPKPETPMFFCVCGTGYQHQSSLSRHQAKCRKLRGRVNDDGGIR